MGVDVTFQPKTPTFVVDSSAAVTIDGRQSGVTSWRIRPVGAVAQYVKWAPGSATAPSAAAPPGLGTPVANEIGINAAGQTVYLEGIGAWLQFIGSGLFATPTYVEITGGQGGAGG